mgnify:CR=1 FL=1
MRPGPGPLTARATMSCDVGPSGLSTGRMPFSSVIRGLSTTARIRRPTATLPATALDWTTQVEVGDTDDVFAATPGQLLVAYTADKLRVAGDLADASSGGRRRGEQRADARPGVERRPDAALAHRAQHADVREPFRGAAADFRPGRSPLRSRCPTPHPRLRPAPTIRANPRAGTAMRDCAARTPRPGSPSIAPAADGPPGPSAGRGPWRGPAPGRSGRGARPFPRRGDGCTTRSRAGSLISTAAGGPAADDVYLSRSSRGSGGAS